MRILNAAMSILDKRRPQSRKNDTWYRIENIADSDTADVYIYDEIGWYGVEAAGFVAEINALNVGNIRLHVNSPGGDAFDGVAIMNALRKHKACVRADVDGLAASAASYIVQGADHITMHSGSRMMIHDASGVAYGNAEELRELADLLEGVSNDIAGIYAERAGGTVEEWRERMRATTWYSAQEAVDAGLADEVSAGCQRGESPDDVAVPNVISALDGSIADINRRRDTQIDSAELLAAINIGMNNLPALPVTRKTENEPEVPDLATALMRGVWS